MAIVIKQKTTVIPVEFEGTNGKTTHKFEFNATDDKLENFRKSLNESYKKIKSIDKNEEGLTAEKQEIKMMSIIKETLDDMCGEGAFEKLYKETKSKVIMVSYVFSIGEGLAGEIDKLGISGKTQKEMADKYLKDKKRKSNK